MSAPAPADEMAPKPDQKQQISPGEAAEPPAPTRARADTAQPKEKSREPSDEHTAASDAEHSTTSRTGVAEDVDPGSEAAKQEAAQTDAVVAADEDEPKDCSSPVSSAESGEASETSSPPLPDEPIPAQEDDGWEYHWDPNTNSYWFYNRFTQVWQQENPRLPNPSTTGDSATAHTTTTPAASAPPPITSEPIGSALGSVANGYNPAIHGDYDPNARYAQPAAQQSAAASVAQDPAAAELYASGAAFNRATGQWQTADQGPERHTDEAKSRRQMNAFFDVDAAANMHDGRSLKAERAGKKPSRSELKAFKEKRRAKKEEKRRAWLRD